jgi:hypothetical protein
LAESPFDLHCYTEKDGSNEEELFGSDEDEVGNVQEPDHNTEREVERIVVSQSKDEIDRRRYSLSISTETIMKQRRKKMCPS